MKLLYKLLFLLLTIPSCLLAQKTETITLKSSSLGKRQILIHTPAEYNDPSKKFEVVYVLDAQQQEIFDAVTSTIVFQNYSIRPMIVVGIVSNNRNKDFLPKNTHPETQQELAGQLGDADLLSDFIEKEVFTYIDKNYRTIPTKIGVGYSNGGTFLNYVLLTKPYLFNTWFSLDANFNYDQAQLTELCKKNISNVNTSPYYYTCQSPTGENWVANSRKYNEILETNKDIKIRKDFFSEETHSTVYQQGIINAFKWYFREQFFTSDNLIQYFRTLEKSGKYSVSKSELHQIAGVFIKAGMKQDAQKLMTAFQEKLSGDIEDSNDLYALFETGDLYFGLGFNEIALKYFMLVDKKLEASKNQLSSDFYAFAKGKITERLNALGYKNE